MKCGTYLKQLVVSGLLGKSLGLVGLETELVIRINWYKKNRDNIQQLEILEKAL